MYRNYFIVFFLSGLWHGAGWNFILWGVLHGILYIHTKKWLKERKRTGVIQSRKIEEKPDGFIKETSVIKRECWQVLTIVGCIFTFAFVSVAWVYFRASSVQQANLLLSNIFTKEWQMPGSGFLDAFNLGEFWYILKILKIANWPYAQSYLMVAFTVTALLLTFLGKNVDELAEKFKPTVVNAGMTAVLFIWCIVSLSGVSTFLYFNF